jgi:hypothetical protein
VQKLASETKRRFTNPKSVGPPEFQLEVDERRSGERLEPVPEGIEDNVSEETEYGPTEQTEGDLESIPAASNDNPHPRPQDPKMSEKMDAPKTLDPATAREAVAVLTKAKLETMRLAREQAEAVGEMCRRAGSELPPYCFDDLIGKGAYGRVYKG